MLAPVAFFVLPADDIAHFAHHVPQFLDFVAQLIHFAASVVAAFLAVASVISVVVATAVVAMGPSLHFLGEVMHAGGMEMFDGYHQVLLTFFHVAMTLMTLTFAVTTFPLVMVMLHFLCEFALQALGFLVQVLLTQFMDMAFLLAYPTFKASFPFVSLMALLGMFVVMMIAALQVALFLLDRAARVLRQPPGFLVPAFFDQFLHFTFSFLGKASKRFMFLVAFPFLLVEVAHSFFRDLLGFSFQFPSFLVATFSCQFLDLT